jgi:hypothetical protein
MNHINTFSQNWCVREIALVGSFSIIIANRQSTTKITLKSNTTIITTTMPAQEAINATQRQGSATCR